MICNQYVHFSFFRRLFMEIKPLLGDDYDVEIDTTVIDDLEELD